MVYYPTLYNISIITDKPWTSSCVLLCILTYINVVIHVEDLEVSKRQAFLRPAVKPLNLTLTWPAAWLHALKLT